MCVQEGSCVRIIKQNPLSCECSGSSHVSDGAAVAALCRDKAALGSVYDSIVAGLRVPRPGVQPCSAATATQPHQLNGWPRKRQHCADDSQAPDTSFPAARGAAVDPEQPDSPTRDAAGMHFVSAVSWALHKWRDQPLCPFRVGNWRADSPRAAAVADPTPAAPGASPAGREEQAAATLFTLADLAGSEV